METIALELKTFLGWGSLLYCLFIFFVVFFARLGLEAMRPTLKTRNWWTNVMLPFLPLLFGALLAWPLRSLFPEIFQTPVAVVMVNGAVLGSFSSSAYQLVNGLKKGVFNLLKIMQDKKDVTEVDVPPADGL